MNTLPSFMIAASSFDAPSGTLRGAKPWRRALLSALLILSLAFAATAQAQIRSFPEKTKVGMLQMGNFPEAILDGKRILFAPGVRIMNVNNATVLPMTLQEPVRIRYRLDALQQVDLAWILSAEEARAASEK